MTTKIVTILPGSRDAFVYSATDKETVIHFNNPAWKNKTCIYVIPGRWKIKSAVRNKLKLVCKTTATSDLNLKPFNFEVIMNGKPYSEDKTEPLMLT